MKKNLLLFLFCFLGITSIAEAYDGVIIVLEAPLLKEPKLNSRVLQTLRKGSRVYVPREIGNLLIEDAQLPEFIQTYDRVGNIAYIPTKYIKIVTHDLSENQMPITLPGVDPTDYRIEEPIPTTYPFDNSAYLRALVAVSLGNNIKAPYDYNSNFSRQSFSTEKGARLILTKKISFDNYDRYYYGFIGSINTVNNTIDFENTNTANENRSILKAGPIITFDAYKTEKLRLTIGTGFTYNYHKSTLSMEDSLGNSEERVFSGYSLSPFTNTIIQLSDVLPMTDLIAGADLNLFLPHTQKSTDEITIPELWNELSPNQIQTGLKPQVSFYLGIQVKY